ncbi:Fe-S cluster assembly transcription factor [Thiorhodovibrio frisius]|uniref:Rrf2 family protein, putative transcriptional regulator n=1 Tax=Thiorhodovibrio frisius TaxID=631362 RepID=H8Z1K8_9GAMM|nr:Fe-S cluster assembly transcription factor [Thiorhodovibrio frisius]EIC21453.1 rrf2 family protein, putative transcriptional regulator [Thiorhodovibrio frisius]WPL24039.1 HTH-type transcriptional regulator IscR [Thiorhodovibrio frisius]
MRLTTKGRYAVTAVLDLAIHHGQGPIALADIARRQGISLSYLEQLFAKLRRQRLVCSVRGPGGGYNLAREMGEIKVAEIIAAVDEHVDATKCGGAGDCYNEGPCLTHDLWMDLSHRIYEYLNQISLRDLVERRCHPADSDQTHIPQEPMMERPQAQPNQFSANA